MSQKQPLTTEIPPEGPQNDYMAALLPKLHALVAFGSRLLGAGALLRIRLEGDTKPECLTDPKLAPVRKHFQNHFPEMLPEKVGGGRGWVGPTAAPQSVCVCGGGA